MNNPSIEPTDTQLIEIICKALKPEHMTLLTSMGIVTAPDAAKLTARVSRYHRENPAPTIPTAVRRDTVRR
jgi:hypothetical protein